MARKSKLPGARVSQLTEFEGLANRSAKRYKKDVRHTHYCD